MRSLCLLHLFALLQSLAAEPFSLLPTPKNVKIYSYNLQQILRWDAVKVENTLHQVTYTVEYKTFVYNYSEICVSIKETQWDFTENINVSWNVKLRVRAEMGPIKSDWVETPWFIALHNTMLGPVKSLTVTASKDETDKLFVKFDPHLISILKEWDFNYNISYWKENSKEKTNLVGKATYVTIPNLEPGVLYCVEVTPECIDCLIVGQVSDAVCERTATPDWTTELCLIIFAIILLSAALVFFFFIYPRRVVIKKWLYQDTLKIPHHVEKFLFNPQIDAPIAMDQEPCEVVAIVDDIMTS
ncbi:interferon gamma receptor 2 [Bombina bombina]|uniref:interferon gamma receptor 2 n=1 Tax=Bombina bombina TaxID=8345 RepID=UPI00235AD431|nr:interferon gamma receptor 2 [Bombina bombina]